MTYTVLFGIDNTISFYDEISNVIIDPKSILEKLCFNKNLSFTRDEKIEKIENKNNSLLYDYYHDIRYTLEI